MSKARTIILWVLQILLAGLFLMASIPKITSHPAAVKMLEDYGYPDNFYLLVGAVELLGALSLLIPKAAGYGASALVVVMLGASLTHLLNDEFSRVLFTGTVMVLLAVVGWMRRPQFLRQRQGKAA